CPGEGLAPLLDRLHTTRTRPVCLDVLNAPAAAVLMADGVVLPPADWVVVLGFEDNIAAVSWQLSQVMEEAAPLGVLGLQARAGDSSDVLWRELTEIDFRPEARLSFKANMLPGAVADFCRLAGTLHGEILLVARAGSGIVRGHVSGDLTVERA